jgi:hypothetical protein
MQAPTFRRTLLSLLLSSSAFVLVLAVSRPVAADPVRVTGTVFIDSAGGDFPDIPLPIDELIYFLGGPGLPEARGEVFATSAVHGTHGGLVVTRPPVPEPLISGSSYNLSSRATFTKGQAIEATWPESGRVYDIAGDFRFTAGEAVLRDGGDGLLLGSAPFTFNGTLQGFAKTTGELLFNDELRGAGRATVHLFQQNPAFFDYRYDIQPTPEPAAILMVVSGIGLVGLRSRSGGATWARRK